MKILVVDDERNVAFTIASLLNSLGHSAETANSGKEALDKMELAKYDVVFLDIRMPEMDGIEVLKTIKERNFEVIPIILTAYGELNTAIEALKFGAYDFLEKPVTRETLKFSIERARKRKEIEEKNVRLKEYETFYTLWHRLIKIHELKELFEEIPKILYDAFEEKFEAFLLVLKPFEEIYKFPPNIEYDIGSLKEILEIKNEIGEEGETKIINFDTRQIAVRYYKPEEDLFFLISIERDKNFREETLKKFEFLCNEISALVTKTYLAHRLKDTLDKLKNIHIHSIKTGTLSLLADIGSELFKTISDPLNMIEKELKILTERSKDLPVFSLIESIEKKFYELKKTFRIIESTVTTGKLELKETDIDEIIGLAYMALLERMRATQINFKRKGEEGLKAIANPSALEISLIHIILNAMDAMPFGGDLVISTEKENGNIKISVIDNGEGIDEEVLEKIFEPFFTTKKEKGGTGLGLTATKWLIEKMEGKIEIESKKGIGTKVNIYLKAVK